MIKSSLRLTQTSLRKSVGRHWLLTIALTLCVPGLSFTCLAQQAESPLPKDLQAVNSSRGDAKVSLATPSASQQMPVADVASADPSAILRSARVIYVRSTSVLVGASTVEEKLRGRSEFQQLKLVITRDEPSADLILELRHDVLTKYVYIAIDPKSQVVVASGKVSSLGGTVAGKVAKRFLKQVTRARM